MECIKYINVSQYRKCQELSKFLQVQLQKPLSTMMKLALMRTATGEEDPELLLLQKISSLLLPTSEIAAQINASEFKKQAHLTSCESGLHVQIAAKKPLLKDTNKKRLAWAKKHGK
jgi:hypothetical protein